MNGNFTFHNPTRLHFGENAMEFLKDELAAFGPTVMLTYGGGSIKKNGIYDQVVAALKAAGKTVVEDGGVMPNPTLEKLMEGAAKAKANNVDLILAVGGGSTIDYSKAVSVSTWCEEDPWEKYFVRFEEPSCRIIPVGSVLTMVGTGSEMNGGSVITNHAANLKVGKVFGPAVFPKFSILNPRFTLTVPRRQMVSGIYDIMSHILEQYFSGTDDNTSDYIAEGLMKSLIVSSRGQEQHHVDRDLGAQHAYRDGQNDGLGGPHARAGRERAHRRHARHDACRGVAPVLSPRQALRTQEVRPLRKERLGRFGGWEE